MEIINIGIKTAKDFTVRRHYAKTFPPHTNLCYGLYRDSKLVGVVMLGWGVRPKHTIQRLFPSLNTSDYLEINRLCVDDSQPRNTESKFLALICVKLRKEHPKIKLLFTWADGIRGKPGYIYQASNFLYGGSIWSEIYITKENEVVHPRLLITRYGCRDKETYKKLGLRKLRGYQFRYIKFLCGHKERKKLLAETQFKWTREYPKNDDLRWTIDAGEGSRETCQITNLESAGQFRNPALNWEFCLRRR